MVPAMFPVVVAVLVASLVANTLLITYFHAQKRLSDRQVGEWRALAEERKPKPATWPPPAPPQPLPSPVIPSIPAPVAQPVAQPIPQADPMVVAREMMQLVTEGVERQMKLMQESMRVAWSPTPAPTAAPGLPVTGNPAVDAILAKYQSLGLNLGVTPANSQYNLPTPVMMGNHDFMTDPTDSILPSDSGLPTHMGAAMIPMVQDEGGLDSLSNPTGIPGFKAGW